MGTHGRGGAVAFVGDDPAAKSSSVPCSSEYALADLMLPTLSPADPGEVLRFAQHAVELSRCSGLWTALRIATVVADGAVTAELSPWSVPDLTGVVGAYSHRPSARLLGAALAELEASMHLRRLPLALEYLRRSGLNVTVGADGAARLGLVVAGSTYLFLRQALLRLGVNEDEFASRGIRILKLGAVFPLDADLVRGFATGLDTILVVEDKRPVLEDAVKSALYGMSGAPVVRGRFRADGNRLFAPTGELDADTIAAALRPELVAAGIGPVRELTGRRTRTQLPLAARAPFFCSGCPHNSSTPVADGTLVGAGIGCHAMVLLMPGKDAIGLTQMGGEGAQWLGMAPFVDEEHFVQNLGDGTFAHSGSLAIRAAVAAGARVTYKLLRNSAVAMTGGQDPVGGQDLAALVALLHAEGVARVVVTSDDPRQARRALRRAGQRSVEVRSRDQIAHVQRDLATVDGVTVLIHDQECAAEKRRKRRRGKAATPSSRVVINERVCEGCGDCGAKSNCLSVQPVNTEYGRKTRINQSSCNLDYSCLAGDCPSFVTITGTRQATVSLPPRRVLPEPEHRFSPENFAMRIAGVGGTGVVTVNQILATAAALSGHAARALDQTGLAQKGGAVVSDLTIGASVYERSPKLAAGECDLYLGCDGLVAADAATLRVCDPERTLAVVSSTQAATGEMVIDPAVSYPQTSQIAATVSPSVTESVFADAAAAALARLGDEQYANMVMVGIAYQHGGLPLPLEAIEAAIELNGAAVQANLGASTSAVRSRSAIARSRGQRSSAISTTWLSRARRSLSATRTAATPADTEPSSSRYGRRPPSRSPAPSR
jgi:indolepyruvate ferredoxin oxidoreductase